MDRNTNMVDDTMQQCEPKLCGSCCQFFGNAASLGMCSKCYREHESQAAKQAAVQEQAVAVAEAAAHVFPIPGAQADPAPTPMVAEPTPMVTTPSSPVAAPVAISPVPSPSPAITTLETASSPSAAAASASTPPEPPPNPSPPVQKHPNRCFSCNKKVGLTGFKCRCTYIFCSEHRYSDKHSCSYDYKAQHKDALTKANPTVVADKIQRI